MKLKTAFRNALSLVVASVVLSLSGCSSSSTTPKATDPNAPTARDMFYRENAHGGSSGGSGGTSSDAGKPSVGCCLELTRDGAEPVPCDNRFVFKSGDALRLHIKVNQPFYVYVLTQGTTGKKSMLYPPDPQEDNRLDPGKECVIPPKGQMVFDDNPGTEHLIVLLFQKPVQAERALDTKAEVIDSNALTGGPTTVGGLSVISSFGANYELGKPVEGDGQIYISNPSAKAEEEPIGFELVLNHSKTGSSSSSSGGGNHTSSSGMSPNAAILADPNCYGILPPYLLKEMASRNPENKSLSRTLDLMSTLPDHSSETKSLGGADDGSVREVYDAQGGGQDALPGTKVRVEGDGPTGKYETDKVYEYTGIVRDFYKELFNRDSIDGNGMKIVSTENFGHNFENAFWNGAQMTYGSPSADSPIATFVLLDVCGHEITHGITSCEQPLTYYGQSGALNESISDVFGVLIKQKANKQSVDKASWVVGEGVWKAGINGRGLRDVLNPGTAYDDPKMGKDDQPAHMKEYVVTTSDSGGVHRNSGIPNRAFALFATAVGGNAWDEPAKIWYETRKVAGPSPSFAQFAYYTIESAKKLNFEDDVEKLEKAWDDVGVTPSETETDTLTPPRAAPEQPHGSS